MELTIRLRKQAFYAMLRQDIAYFDYWCQIGNHRQKLFFDG